MKIITTPYLMTAEEREKNLLCWQALCKEAGAELSEICFLDIETTGFSRLYCSIYLIGFVAYEDGKFITRQYLAEDIREEGIMLRKVLDDLKAFRVVGTYNGDMFDIPFVRERAVRVRVFEAKDNRWLSEMTSLDLMRRYRPYRRLFGWQNMKLKTVEASLGAARQDPFDGGQLIEVYEEYEKSGDERLEKTLLLHNYEDIVNLLSLLKIERLMQEIRAGRPLSLTLREQTLSVEWDRPFSLSLRAKIPLGKNEEASAVFGFQAGEAGFSIRLFGQEDLLRYYLPHPEDYYFLPEEEEIVHRSLAYDIPASKRKKAKAEQCFVPAPEGDYIGSLPVPDEGLKAYRTGCKDTAVYYEINEFREWVRQAKEPEISEYLRAYLSLIL